MNIEMFIEKIVQLTRDTEIRKELENGLKIKFTIDKERTDIVALRPRSKVPGGTLG
jgi:hypothetical protein